ncbi:MAG: YebC/PmpR family DNA-binding transcriptional regulator [Aphanocapsa sp. GSE-SYN-MK-11-07L]|jgi:YebC/PmpR family DNA-binding regulatory protein|nr:YebC/PmpR family DNA-binding transcriptional regulator [Aphanocapsa sp. GSE-SYN-MK-11-07L]
MAGHSKWANIKRQKARVDAQKGKVFARISRAIIVAARQGVPDPEANFQLRTAIEKARAVGIPNDNIERAIAKGAGKLGTDGNELAEIRYEGYGPGGVAVLIEALTDNRNRTAADLRAAFSKQEGNLGETGCVGWMFKQTGIVTVIAPPDEEAFLEVLLEAGADSYEIVELEEATLAEVTTGVSQLEALSQVLKQQDYSVQEAELRWVPTNSLEITDPDQARRILKLMDALEDLDDVQSVTANFEMGDRLLAEMI